MSLLTQKPKGTLDIVPSEIKKWATIEKIAYETAEQFGFTEIRLPTFEHTELFTRSVGETTDVVQKEMYTFNDKGNRSITLRPEGTAGTVRALLENGLNNGALPVKLFYILSCFRYEKPQAGRLREFHQFGVEMFGSSSPVADAEVISLAYSVLQRIGIKKLALNLNSIGCPCCRGKYHTALIDFLSSRKDSLCESCKGRIEKNPMRVLDCKSPVCSDITKDAPLILDFLCEECSTHFNSLKKNLDAMDIKYSVNPRIVRGLDYYTKTVFEFITDEIGAQGTVCGGGRYDGLVEQMGGKPSPALGFAIGLERLIMLAQKQGCDFLEDNKCDLYIATLGENATFKAVELVNNLRQQGHWAEMDTMDRGLKSQMKYADKIGASFSLVLGDSELENNSAKLKNMTNGEIIEIKLDDSFCDKFSDIAVGNMFKDFGL